MFTADRLNDMNAQADSLLESEQFDRDQINERRNAIKNRYDHVKKLAADRRDKLNKALNVHQFLRDIDDEERWLNEKRLLISSELVCNYFKFVNKIPIYRWHTIWLAYKICAVSTNVLRTSWLPITRLSNSSVPRVCNW